jgi:transposase InsO family protein
MTIHKRTRLTPIQRKELAHLHWDKKVRVCDLMRKYSVSAPTVYKILKRARLNDYLPHKSVNQRYRCLEYGMKRLAKVEQQLEEKLKRQAKRYEKNYPGEMLHGDTKRLPLLEGDSSRGTHEYLFVAVDDYSRELYAAILPDKTQHSSKAFLDQVLVECPYTIEQWYTDNGLEYKGRPEHHAFMKLCAENKIEQRFTRVRRPQTNGKAERIIRTVMEMWHNNTRFKSSAHRKQELIRFVNWYNTVKPHKSIGNHTPYERLIQYFYPSKL